jgi:NAD-dependent DNA ligase
MRREIMKILAPTNCPSCDSLLTAKNDILYCINKDCGATSAKKVEHFAKTIKVKGLGPAAIEKLELNNIAEIYDIDVGYMTFCLGSAKLAIKLFSEIENSKQQQLNTLLPAFGIPLIGKTATEKLSKVCDSLFDINEETCKAAGLGPKETENLMNWLNSDYQDVCDLPFSWKFDKRPVATEQKGVICISGKLKSFKTKAEATSVLEELGYTVKDSLTKDVTILVSEEGRATAKTAKAEQQGIRIVNNLKDLIGEN